MATYERTPRATPRRWFLLAVCGAAVVLTTGTGLGAWRLSQPGQRSSTASPRQTQVQQRGPQAGGVAVASIGKPVVRSVGTPSLVLVASPEQATAVQQGTEEADVVRATLGLPPLQTAVLQTDAAADVSFAVQTITEENALRASLGLPAIQVDDLRSQ